MLLESGDTGTYSSPVKRGVCSTWPPALGRCGFGLLKLIRVNNKGVINDY